MNSDSDQSRLSESEQERWKELHEVPFDDLSDEEITAKIRLSVKRRFDYPEWVLMFEYGAPNGRVADCLAVNTMPSRNYKIVGFEFKASRSDWLRELKDGEKADHFVRLVDEWYVVSPKGVVQESELPAGWGYLELKPNSEQLYKLQESELTDHQQGEPDRRFWIKFVKRTVGDDSNFGADDLREARNRGYREASTEKAQKRHLDVDVENLQQKADSYDRLREDLGFLPWRDIDDEEARTIELAYELISALDDDRYDGFNQNLRMLEDSIERYSESLEENVGQLRQAMEELRDRVEDDLSLSEDQT